MQERFINEGLGAANPVRGQLSVCAVTHAMAINLCPNFDRLSQIKVFKKGCCVVVDIPPNSSKLQFRFIFLAIARSTIFNNVAFGVRGGNQTRDLRITSVS